MEAKYRVLFLVSAIVATYGFFTLSVDKKFMALTSYEKPQVTPLDVIAHSYPFDPDTANIVHANKPFFYNTVIIPKTKQEIFTFFNGGFSDPELLERPVSIVWSYYKEEKIACLEFFTEETPNVDSCYSGTCLDFNMEMDKHLFAMTQEQYNEIAFMAGKFYRTVMIQASRTFPLLKEQDPRALMAQVDANAEGRAMQARLYIAKKLTEHSRYLQSIFLSIMTISIALLVVNFMSLFVVTMGNPLSRAYQTVVAFYKGIPTAELRQRKFDYIRDMEYRRNGLRQRLANLDPTLTPEVYRKSASDMLDNFDLNHARALLAFAESNEKDILKRRILEETAKRIELQEKEEAARKAVQQKNERCLQIERLREKNQKLPLNKRPPNFEQLLENLNNMIEVKERDWKISLYEINKLLPEE